MNIKDLREGLSENGTSLDLFGTELSDSDVHLLVSTEFANVRRLSLRGTKVSKLGAVVWLKKLEMLDLSWTQVSDAELFVLGGLEALATLDLTRTRVLDISPLSRLKNLRHLFLGCTDVSDLHPLAGLRALEGLYVSNTKVSDLGPLALQRQFGLAVYY